jgi:4-amino-4-deoxy-L-arabinose transferase-like glycosyltransferase
LISVCLSFWCYTWDKVINTDGILYVNVANKISAGDWQGAMSIFNWPFYSWLISLVSRVGLDPELAAHYLNALFFLTIVVAFISIVKCLGANRDVVVAAALLILLYPSLNEYRSYVIRDHGFLAGYLLALLSFLKYCETKSWFWAVAWGAAMTVASLFRVEGAFFLCLVPYVLFLSRNGNWRHRVAWFLKAHVVFISATLGLLGWWFLAVGSVGNSLLRRSQIVALWGYIRVLVSTLVEKLPEKAQAVSSMLHEDASAYAMSVVVAAVLMMVCTETLKTVGPFFGILAGHGIGLEEFPQSKEKKRALLAFVTLNIGYLLAVTLLKFNLTGRSALTLAVTLILWMPSSLLWLHESWTAKRGLPLKKNWVFPTVCLGFLWFAAGGLISIGPSKDYLREAGLWIQGHATEAEVVFCNDTTVLYYAGRSTGAHTRSPQWAETVEALRAQAEPWKKYD